MLVDDACLSREPILQMQARHYRIIAVGSQEYQVVAQRNGSDKRIDRGKLPAATTQIRLKLSRRFCILLLDHINSRSYSEDAATQQDSAPHGASAGFRRAARSRQEPARQTRHPVTAGQILAVVVDGLQ